MHQIVGEAIDDFIELGRCDLVKDFADRVPATATMEMLDLPVEGWGEFAGMFHHFVSDAPPEGELRSQPSIVYDYIAEQLDARRASPRDDRLTWILNLEVDGQKMPEDVLLETVFLLMVAGYDTTAALLSNVLLHLSHHDDDRRRLIAHPDLLDSAGEEFLRAFTPVLSLARTTTKDVEVAGTLIPAGSRVLLSWYSANHDEKVYAAPEEIILDRFPNRHQAFGLGSHRCLGSFIARANLKLTLSEVLTRMPDYVIDESAAVPFATLGANNGWHSLPATFTPGARRR
jgi:cytochrome P450